MDELTPNNEAAAHPDSGATPNPGTAAPAPPSDPQAQGASLAAENAALKAKLDAHYANARRNGELAKPTGKTAAKPGASSKIDPIEASLALRSFDRALGAYGDVPPAAYQRMVRAYLEEGHSDAEAFITEWGLTKVAQPATTLTAATVPAARNEHPVTDRGSPSASRVPLAEADIRTLNPTDLAALQKQLGPKEYTRRLLAQLQGVAIKQR